jgi:hypothetical protein
MQLTQDLLAQLFEYRNGKLYWRSSQGNQIKKGSLAGWPDKVYMRVMINETAYLAHRVIYLMHHGYLPDFVDHINGDATDNRIENLRAATRSDNNRNRRINGNNKSGIKGVHWDAPRNKWKAQLCIAGKQQYLGLYDTLEEAAAIVQAARVKHHGEFTRHQ